MERKTCSFCARRMEPGTGKLLVKRDGSLFYFCSSKCEKNHALGRTPRKVTWVRKAMKET
ncbi:MAG: 50S ribosomal protein L24e [Euryarchaeota archaeon]|nr:50S ribosomal protein L24e [Euryarchaeota archaeon]